MREDVKERIRLACSNKVPRGFQRTNAGLMPTDWLPMRTAGEIFTNHSNKRHDGTSTVLSATQDKGIVPRSEVDIDIKYDEENLTGYKKVDSGDFIISLRSFQGGIEYSALEGLVSPAYTVLKNTMPIADDYYKNYFKTVDFISRLNSATYGIRDGKQIGYEDFRALVLHYPPLKEQQKIAEILNHCDKVIELKQRLIEEERCRKNWMMRKLLDPDSGVRLSGFSGKWIQKKLGQLGESTIGLTYDLKDVCDVHGKLVLRSSNIKDGKFVFDDNVYVSCGIPEELNVKKGDIIICARNGSQKLIGKSAYVNQDMPNCTFGAFMTVYRSNETEFIYHFLQTNSFLKQVSKSFGARINQLTTKTLLSIKMYIPVDKDEKAAIAKLLFNSDRKVDLLEQEITQWQLKKKALSQLLLTGLVRVTA